MSIKDDYNMIDGIINNGPKQPECEPEKPSVPTRLRSTAPEAETRRSEDPER